MFIVEVFPNGAAHKDGRLQAGDQILEICSQSFKEIEHDEAHAAVMKVSGTVRFIVIKKFSRLSLIDLSLNSITFPIACLQITMVVHRQEKGEEEIEVELQKKSGKGAGLCLTGYKSGKGAYVSDLVRFQPTNFPLIFFKANRRISYFLIHIVRPVAWR